MQKSKEVIKVVLKEPFEGRIPKLRQMGIIGDSCLLVASDGIRPIVIAKLADVSIPFYRSANGTSGKKKGSWFGFFGFGSHYLDKPQRLDWMVKGSLEQVESNYDCNGLRYLSEIINATLNWEHALDLQPGKNKYFHAHITVTGIERKDFNNMVYGVPCRNIVWGQPSAWEAIATDCKKIDAAFKQL
jgi:hypothetical protein